MRRTKKTVEGALSSSQSQQPPGNPVAWQIPPARSHGNAWRSRIAERWVLWLAVAFFAGMAFPFLRRGDGSEWQTCYVRAGRRMMEGDAIHHSEPNAYAYPPLMAMCAAPFSRVSPRMSLTLWYAINVVAMVVVVESAWRMTGGPALVGLQGRWAAVFGLATLLSFRFLAAPLENQQSDVVIAALLFVGCRRLWAGRDFAAAIWLGVAAAMKCTPLLFAPYLAWRGKFKSACLLVLVAVALNRLPDYVFPKADGAFRQEQGGTYLADWMSTFLIRVGRDAPGAWESDLVLNQSLSGLANRVAQAGVPLSTADIPTSQAVLSSATMRSIRMAVYGACLALAGVTAWRLGRPGRPLPPVEPVAGGPSLAQGELVAPYGRNPGVSKVPERRTIDVQDLSWEDLRSPVEAAIVMCVMLLLSPMSSKAHYVVLVLPVVLYARDVVEGRRAWLRWLLVPLIILGPLTSKGLTGKLVGDLTLCWGFPTEFVLVLLLAMWVLITPALQPRDDSTY